MKKEITEVQNAYKYKIRLLITKVLFYYTINISTVRALISHFTINHNFTVSQILHYIYYFERGNTVTVHTI
jgi:hypothetical protein